MGELNKLNKVKEIYLSLFHTWMRLPEKIRFLLVGGYNYVFANLFLYNIFLFILHKEHAQVALIVSFLLSTPNSYLMQKFYVFNTRGNYLKEYIKCIETWFIGYVVNAILLQIFLTCGMGPSISQAIASALIAILSYCLLKYVAFRKGHPNEII